MMKLAQRIVILAALVAAFVFLAPVAFAHEWFTNSGCCSGKDCQPWIPTSQNLEVLADGSYHIRLSRSEVLAINRESKCDGIDEVIPRNSSKIKASPVSSFGLCVKYYDRDDGTCVRCLFVPGDI